MTHRGRPPDSPPVAANGATPATVATRRPRTMRRPILAVVRTSACPSLCAVRRHPCPIRILHHTPSPPPLAGHLGIVGCHRATGCRPPRRLPGLPTALVSPWLTAAPGLPSPSACRLCQAFRVSRAPRPIAGLLWHVVPHWSPSPWSARPPRFIVHDAVIITEQRPDLACDRIDHPPAAIDSIRVVRLT